MLMCDSNSWLGHFYTFINGYHTITVSKLSLFSFGLSCKTFNKTFKYSF